MKIRKTILTAVGIGAVAAVLAGCGSTPASHDGDGKTQEGPVSIRVGYTPDPGGAPLLAIAEDQGFFERNGVKPTLTPFATGPIQVQAMGTNDLDVGWIGPGAMWLPADGKAKVISMNLVDLSDVILANPKSGIKTVADLKGKEIGVPEGTSGDMLLMQALSTAGMTVDDIKKVQMDPATLVSAFSSGNIDAVAIWRAAVSSVFTTMPNVTVVASDEDYYPDYVPVGGYVVSDKFLKASPDGVKRFVRALQEANDYRYSHPDETLAITSKFLQVEPDRIKPIFDYVKYYTTAEFVKYTEDGTVEKWLQHEVDFFDKLGRITTPVPVSQFYLSDMYVEASKG